MWNSGDQCGQCARCLRLLVIMHANTLGLQHLNYYIGGQNFPKVPLNDHCKIRKKKSVPLSMIGYECDHESCNLFDCLG